MVVRKALWCACWAQRAEQLLCDAAVLPTAMPPRLGETACPPGGTLGAPISPRSPHYHAKGGSHSGDANPPEMPPDRVIHSEKQKLLERPQSRGKTPPPLTGTNVTAAVGPKSECWLQGPGWETSWADTILAARVNPALGEAARAEKQSRPR